MTSCIYASSANFGGEGVRDRGMVCKKCKWFLCSIIVLFETSRFTDLGEKKLGRVICPDPWKSGARNTVGRPVYFYHVPERLREVNSIIFIQKVVAEKLVKTKH